jgi:hypothetical protein
MCPAIDNPPAAKFTLFIQFLPTKNMSDAEIHGELCTVYGQIVMSEGTVR